MDFKQIPLIFLFALASCTTYSSGNGIAPDGRPVCLTDCEGIPAAIEAFKQSHTLGSERDEIDYLLYRIRSSDAKLYRNGSTYNGSDAARFLRWKLGWWYKTYHEVIDTDEDFVAKVLSGSKKSGEPYQIIFPDGSRHNAQAIMQNELNVLNSQSEMRSLPGSPR